MHKPQRDGQRDLWELPARECIFGWQKHRKTMLHFGKRPCEHFQDMNRQPHSIRWTFLVNLSVRTKVQNARGYSTPFDPCTQQSPSNRNENISIRSLTPITHKSQTTSAASATSPASAQSASQSATDLDCQYRWARCPRAGVFALLSPCRRPLGSWASGCGRLTQQWKVLSTAVRISDLRCCGFCCAGRGGSSRAPTVWEVSPLRNVEVVGGI